MISRQHLDHNSYTLLNAWVMAHKDILRLHHRDELAVMAQGELNMPVTVAHIAKAGRHTNLLVGKLSGKKHRLHKKDIEPESPTNLAELAQLEKDIKTLASVVTAMLQRQEGSSSKWLDEIVTRRVTK